MGKVKKDKNVSSSPAHKYAVDVLAGKIVAGKWIKLACKRYIDDLKNGHKRGLSFDHVAGQHAIDFIEKYCRHSKGEWAGQPVILSDWQRFLIWQIFGWKRADGSRRFRFVYCEVARKNGKTTLAAAINLYMLVADGEAGAECYCAATKRDQAKICFGEAQRMVRQSGELKGRIESRVGSLHYRDSKSEPLGADVDGMDGLNPQLVIVDELHAHKTRAMWDVLVTALGARRQPLLFAITTAGSQRHSICWEQRDYSESVLQGIIKDDSWLAMVYAVDKKDDCLDESVWVKANPNLGVSKKMDYMRTQAGKAKSAPASKMSFQRLDCNVWNENVSAYVPLEEWDKAAPQAYDTTGGACWAGLDLANSKDIAAYVELFDNPDDNKLDVECCFWLPADAMTKRVFDDRVPYDVWVEQGFIKLTPGNLIDFEYIENELIERATDHEIREIAFDPWNAAELSTRLMSHGLNMVKFPQTISHYAAPTKALEEYVIGGRLRHGGNPVLRWMAANLVVWIDGNDNKRPDKKNSREKIDGMTALIMALSRAMVHAAEPDSPYETMGV